MERLVRLCVRRPVFSAVLALTIIVVKACVSSAARQLKAYGLS